MEKSLRQQAEMQKNFLTDNNKILLTNAWLIRVCPEATTDCKSPANSD